MEKTQLLSESDLSEIIAHYDIGAYVSMNEYTTGTIQQTIEVKTTQGK